MCVLSGASPGGDGFSKNSEIQKNTVHRKMFTLSPRIMEVENYPGEMIQFDSCFSFPTWCFSKNWGFDPPKWMVKIMENPMKKWMIWGYTPIFGNTHIERLGGGNSNIFLCSSRSLGKMNPFCLIFSSGLKPPTRGCLLTWQWKMDPD